MNTSDLQDYYQHSLIKSFSVSHIPDLVAGGGWSVSVSFHTVRSSCILSENNKILLFPNLDAVYTFLLPFVHSSFVFEVSAR